jgi:hypothetical protein
MRDIRLMLHHRNFARQAKAGASAERVGPGTFLG